MAGLFTTLAVKFGEGSLGMVVGCREGDAAAVVVSVRPGGAADEGSVVVGDVVSRVNGRRVGDYDAVLEQLAKAGKPVTISFERENANAEEQASPPVVAAAPTESPAAKDSPPSPPKVKEPPAPLGRMAQMFEENQARPQVVSTTTIARDEIQRSGGLSVAERAGQYQSTRTRNWTSEEIKGESRGRVAERWQKMQVQHQQDVQARFAKAKYFNPGDDDAFIQVKDKVKYFDDLFNSAVDAAMSDARAMSETDRARAARERLRRREMQRLQFVEDEKRQRASRPTMENVAAHPDELAIALSKPPPGMKMIYALVDVSTLEQLDTAAAAEANRGLERGGSQKQRFQKQGEGKDEDVNSAVNQKITAAAANSHSWHDYEAPLHFSEPGRFAVLSKAVPIEGYGGREAQEAKEEQQRHINKINAAKEARLSGFERSARKAESDQAAPHGYEQLANALVDAVRLGLIGRTEAYAILERAKAGELGDLIIEAQKWRAACDGHDPDLAAAQRAKREERALAEEDARKQEQLNARTGKLNFFQGGAEDADGALAIASAGEGLYRGVNQRGDPGVKGDGSQLSSNDPNYPHASGGVMMMGGKDGSDGSSGGAGGGGSSGRDAPGHLGVPGAFSHQPGESNSLARGGSGRTYESSRQPPQPITYETFVDACETDDLAIVDDLPPISSRNAVGGKDTAVRLEESEIATAVYELGESPPLMQHEEHAGEELTFVSEREAKERQLCCAKCGSQTKLYGHGDYAICRVCALEGAGVLVDPGARRMWFSQMIGFVGGSEIPLPKSQPLLAQILRVMQKHPGLSVRFEGHVNSYCGLDCDGTVTTGCINSKDVPGNMCGKCKGGAVGLSFARANAIKEFVQTCGIEPDRLKAEGFAGTRRLTGDIIDEETGHVNRRVEVHTLLC